MLIKKYKVESYTIREFLNMEEISYLDRAIDHIKRNKKKYMLLVTIIAFLPETFVAYQRRWKMHKMEELKNGSYCWY